MPGGTTPPYYLFLNILVVLSGLAIAGVILQKEEVYSERIAKFGIITCLSGLFSFVLSFLGWYPGYINPVFEPFRGAGWTLLGIGLIIFGFAILWSVVTEDLHNRNNKLNGKTDKLPKTFKLLLLVVATGLGYFGCLCI